MRIFPVLAIAILLAGAAGSEEAREPQAPRGFTCPAYLAEPEPERDRIAAMALWVWMRKNADQLQARQAGELMASLPRLRDSLDRDCDSGGSLGTLAAGAVDRHVVQQLSEGRVRQQLRGSGGLIPGTGKP